MNYPGAFGVDMSSSISKTVTGDKWRCMHQQGNYSFAIIEGWQGGYGQNTGLAAAIAGAWSGGFSHVDVYAFMCSNCHNGPESAKSLVEYLRSHNSKFGQIWLDVEQCQDCWSKDLSSNCEFVKSLAQQYESMGVKVGVYASEYEWSITVGSSCRMDSHPLWYADYDENPSFSGFRSFGGWTHPAMKQFADHAGNSCGVSVDRNWYPL